MKKTGLIAAAICVVCLLKTFDGREISLAMAQRSQPLMPQKAIDAARRDSEPGSSFVVLREIVANADTRHVADQALQQAKARQIELFQNGILVDLLRSGGFLIAEYNSKTTNVVALHFVSLRPDGVPKDVLYPGDGKLGDVREVVKDTAEFTEELLSTPSSEALSLKSRFYGRSFPECGHAAGHFEECTPFAIPRSLLKLGASQNEYREAALLSGALAMWQFRYAVSMPVFAASPLAAIQSTGNPIAEFLRNNHMATNFDFDLGNIRSKKELRERIDVLRRLNKFLEGSLGKEADPTVVNANISVATLPFGGVGPDTSNDQTRYNCGTASLIRIEWQRLPTGGFAVRYISEAG